VRDLPAELLKEFWIFDDASLEDYDECAAHVAASLSALPEPRLGLVKASLRELLSQYTQAGWPVDVIKPLEAAANSRWAPPHHVALRGAIEAILRDLG
jgi:hypothetical protein